MGAWLGILALAVAFGVGALWYQRLKAVRTAEVRGLVIGGMALGAVLAIWAFVEGPGLLSGLAAGGALVLSGVFLALQPLAGQSREAPAVGVGERILDFTAPDAEGAPFDLARLHGRPFLLKFFRGHW